MVDPQLRPILDALHSDGRLRIWSIVITIFGDVVQPRGGSIAMADLIELTAPLGIEEGALRTAMSRLAKDGWVESTRNGRLSRYALTESGRAEFVPATARIYQPPGAPEPNRWTLLLANPGGVVPDGMHPTPGVTLIPAGDPVPADMFAITGSLENVPDWTRAALAPSEIGERFRELITLFGPLDPSGLETQDAMSARLLLIHFWRRIVLRYDTLPMALRPRDWPEQEAHSLVAGLYRNLWPLSASDTASEEASFLAGRF